MLPPPPRSTLFPYTTLFRSRDSSAQLEAARAIEWLAHPQMLSARCGLHWRARGQSRPERPYASSTTRYDRSEEHTSELQSLTNLVCRLLLEKKKKKTRSIEK